MNMVITPNIDSVAAKEPAIQIDAITGTRILFGIVMTLDINGMSTVPQKSEMMFARNSDAMQAHAKSGLVVKRSGPGCNPPHQKTAQKNRARSRTGDTQRQRGANAPAAAELLAASQAEMPSIAPSPYGIGTFLKFFF